MLLVPGSLCPRALPDISSGGQWMPCLLQLLEEKVGPSAPQKPPLTSLVQTFLHYLQYYLILLYATVHYFTTILPYFTVCYSILLYYNNTLFTVQYTTLLQSIIKR